MATVTGLASHLLSLLQPNASSQPDVPSAGIAAGGSTVPKVDAARLAFYHFLKNLCEPGEPLSTSVLDRFFRRALSHAHWAENKTALFDEVTSCLQHFSNQHGEPLPLPPFSSPSELQVLKAEDFKTVERIVEEWTQAHQGPTDQVKIIRDGDQKLVVCRLASDRSFSVHLFDRMLCIQDGRLSPLTDDMAVHYTSELSIDPYRPSQIEVAPHTIARFRAETISQSGSSGIRGLTARGFTFQKTASFDGADLYRYPLLLYPLKRVEQFFINRTTDPMYLELTSLLEKASDLLAQKHPEAVRFADAAIERGRLAFEQVFIDDRFMRLLLENLQRALELERRPTTERPPTDLNLASDLEVGNKLGLNLVPGQEFIEPFGPDLVELQEAESCETIAPVNRPLKT
ncbi:MAG: hypothetical protein RBT63_06150 [Bdellovibrionales bacterium]|jgi:hypothetical protein|nr:hypothetical protein [Bdellovibrionales bacterium]